MKNPLTLIKPFVVKHEPEILLSMGIAGMIFSTIYTVKATKDAEKKINIKKKELKKDKLTFVETVKATWVCYIPPVASMVVSIPCLIGSYKIQSGRNAAIAAAYTMTETALQQYQEAAKEVVGEKKEQVIHEKACEKAVHENPPTPIYIPTGDESLFCIKIGNIYFKSTYNKIWSVVNELNARSVNDVYGYITLSELYESLGLYNYINNWTDSMGWSIGDQLKGDMGIIKLRIEAVMTTDNVPCCVIDFWNPPVAIK
jgi:hypothetical protein